MTENEALKLLEQNGKNEIVSEKRKNILFIFLSQFNDVLIIILIISAIMSFYLNDKSSAIIILIVLLINAIIGTIQYVTSIRQVDALKKFTVSNVYALRDLEYKQIDSRNLVKGDVIKLKKGDVIPCDCMLLEAKNLTIDESSITGESIGISKAVDDLVYGGTIILSGNLVAKCVNMGMDSKIGEIQKMLNKTKNRKTPLEKKLDKLSFALAAIILTITALIYLYNIYNGIPIIDALMFSISLAVAAIPEAMSCVILIILACKTLETARMNIIIKNLKIIETLGNVNLICCDKTGTLTKNDLAVSESFILDEELFDKYLSVIDTDETMDLALKKLNKKKYDLRIVDRIDFDSIKKSSTVLLSNNIQYTKGASDKILPLCKYIKLDTVKEIRNYRTLIDNNLNKMLEEGLRVVAIAYKQTDAINENDLIFLGLIGFSDTLKDEAKDVIKDLHDANIKVVMITGDHKKTASIISKKVGIGDKGYKSFNKDADFYYRVSPKDKIDFVKKYQDLGYIVAMIGDGVNDAPALKKADVGISMGSGVNVSNEASDMVILDDDLRKIPKAIENGRGIFLNIKSSIRFLIAGNLASIICVLYTMIIGLPKPFYAIHLLFINLLTDSIPAISIGLEKNSENLLKIKYKNENIINRRLFIKIAIEGIFIAISVMLSYYYGLSDSSIKAATMAFYTLSIARLLHSVNCLRGGNLSKLHLASILIGIIFLLLLLIVKPIYQYIDIVYLNKIDLLYVGLYSILPFLLIKFLKVFNRWKK